jgi:uncharacterized protein (DUF934 family)
MKRYILSDWDGRKNIRRCNQTGRHLKKLNWSKTAKEKGQIHGRKKRLIVSITKKDIIGLLLKQNFCCSLTGIEFPTFNTQIGYKKASSMNNINSKLF